MNCLFLAVADKLDVIANRIRRSTTTLELASAACSAVASGLSHGARSPVFQIIEQMLERHVPHPGVTYRAHCLSLSEVLLKLPPGQLATLWVGHISLALLKFGPVEKLGLHGFVDFPSVWRGTDREAELICRRNLKWFLFGDAVSGTPSVQLTAEDLRRADLWVGAAEIGVESHFMQPRNAERHECFRQASAELDPEIEDACRIAAYLFRQECDHCGSEASPDISPNEKRAEFILTTRVIRPLAIASELFADDELFVKMRPAIDVVRYMFGEVVHATSFVDAVKQFKDEHGIDTTEMMLTVLSFVNRHLALCIPLCKDVPSVERPLIGAQHILEGKIAELLPLVTDFAVDQCVDMLEWMFDEIILQHDSAIQEELKERELSIHAIREVSKNVANVLIEGLCQKAEEMAKEPSPAKSNGASALKLVAKLTQSGQASTKDRSPCLTLVDGGYTLCGQPFDLTGRPRQALAALFGATHYRMTVHNLANAMSIDDEKDTNREEIAKEAIKDLRKSLVEACSQLGITCDHPIESTGRGRDHLTYKLAGTLIAASKTV